MQGLSSVGVSFVSVTVAIVPPRSVAAGAERSKHGRGRESVSQESQPGRAFVTWAVARTCLVLRSRLRNIMEFRILGPLEARQGEASLPLGPEKQRALLAVLLL